MYFLRIDYIYKCSSVQRVRLIVSDFSAAMQAMLNYQGDDYLVLLVKLEFCC